MALKRENNLMAVFSMASLTDVIFLLLIFFMVTSTYVFPTALEIDLPQSSQQTAVKPALNIYYDAEAQLSVNVDGGDLQSVADMDALEAWLRQAAAEHPDSPVALRADSSTPYGKIVEIINTGARADVKVVLATKAPQTQTSPQQ